MRLATEESFPVIDELPEVGDELNEEFSLSDLSNETGISDGKLAHWINSINRKGQAILYGPPGTGKTFLAEHLAKHLISGQRGFCDLLQFHPSYTYEEFMQGIRPEPNDSGGLRFPVVPGRFMKFCREAETRKPDICVLIIDEINRANLAKVFGELMYLLEYREKRIPLASGEVFGIPQNVRIIGTMNTADRSIAIVDFALMRRFAFIRLQPDFDLLERYLEERCPGFDRQALIGLLKELNGVIREEGFMVGITFFLDENLKDSIESIWSREIEPYLEEFFFDRPEIVERYRWNQVSSQLGLDSR